MTVSSVSSPSRGTALGLSWTNHTSPIREDSAPEPSIKCVVSIQRVIMTLELKVGQRPCRRSGASTRRV
jgi:hypothetical protein